MSVHFSGYYAWLHQPKSRREIDDIRFTGLIKQYWLESGGHYGYRNITSDLKEARELIGKDRVLRLMQQANIKAQRGYREPRYHPNVAEHPVAGNLLKREFEVEAPNQWWVSDITYIRTYEGFLFIAVVMDLFARNIIGWAMDSRMKEELVLEALTMAYWRRKPEDRVMLHSDQGSQYTSRACQKLLVNLNIEPSMSRKGNCWDNAVAESFFANLKKERIRRQVYKSRAIAREDVFNYIELFYNPKRRHTHNGRIAPAVYEQQYFENQEGV